MLIYLCFYEEIRVTYCVSVSVYKIVLSSSNPEVYLEICRRPVMEPNADIALYADLADVTEYNIKNIFEISLIMQNYTSLKSEDYFHTETKIYLFTNGKLTSFTFINYYF